MRKFIALLLLLQFAAPGLVQAADFDPGVLITDERFTDVQTLGGAEGIQLFLEKKGSILANTSPDFLLKLREPDASLKEKLPDPRPNLGRLRTAAELIYDAATAAGLNPQIVLVTLNKEQSLIEKQFASEGDLQRALDRALGFGCPDGSSCGEIFLGFYNQLFGNFDAEGNRYIGMPGSLMRSFYYEVNGVRVGRGPMVDAVNNAFGSSARVRTAQKGDSIVLENTQGPPYNAPATQAVTLNNFATTALYRYTPHVYNGNFNFFKFFNAWFRYANGTIVKNLGGTESYVIDNGYRRLISSFVITQRKLDTTAPVTLSPTEMIEFPLGEVMPPVDGTMIKDSTSQTFLISEGKRKLLSSFVAKQRGLDPVNAILLTDAEVKSYADGGVALPEEGTLVKAKDNPAVYVITNNQKRLLTAFVFTQRGYKFADILSAEPGELDTYPTGAVMTPSDGTLIKAKEESLVYYVGNGLLQPLTSFVFRQRNFSFRNIVSVPKSELANWPLGTLMPPETGILVKGRTDPTVYYMEAGVRRGVSYAVFLARRFSFSEVMVAEDEELQNFEKGDDLLLPERALVKVKDLPTVYYVVDGVLRPLTFTAFQNRRLLFSDVVTISPEELQKYEIGAVVEN